MTSAGGPGPALFAYDGSDLAKLAIEEAARQLQTEREALVVTVWEPFNVQFVPVLAAQLDASAAESIQRAAEQSAAEGASFAEAAGFRARSIAVRRSPTWMGLVEVADERDASLIVLGSHGRRGLSRAVIGSVAAAVVQHSQRSVLIVHRRP
jgi:nucleotide-binding universal stress UspA family protein